MKHIYIVLVLALVMTGCSKGAGPQSGEVTPDLKKEEPKILPEFLTPMPDGEATLRSSENFTETELEQLKQNTEKHIEFLKATPTLQLLDVPVGTKPQSHFWSKIIREAHADEAPLPNLSAIVRCVNNTTYTMGQLVNRGMTLQFDVNMKTFLHFPGPAANNILMESVYRDDVETDYYNSDNYASRKLPVGRYVLRSYHIPFDSPVSYSDLYESLYDDKTPPAARYLLEEKQVDAHSNLASTLMPLNGNYDFNSIDPAGFYVVTLSDDSNHLLQGSLFSISTFPSESGEPRNPHLYLEKVTEGEETFVKIMLNRNLYPSDNEIFKGVLIVQTTLNPTEIEAVASSLEERGIVIEPLDPVLGLYRITASTLNAPSGRLVELGRVRVRLADRTISTKIVSIQRAELYTRLVYTSPGGGPTMVSETPLSATWNQTGISFGMF